MTVPTPLEQANDRLVQSMLPTAAALTCAVADRDREEVARVLTGLDTKSLHALAVVLAAHVDPDKPFIPAPVHTAPIVAIVHSAALRFRVTETLIVSVNRSRDVVDARSVACYAARLAGMTLTDIGRHVHRDHSTVFHACTRVGEDHRLRRVANAILDELGFEVAPQGVLAS